jgi:hypothetical protein
MLLDKKISGDKGRYSLDIDLLRWAANRLLQSVFTLHQMKRGEMELAQRKRDDASTQYSIFLNPRLMVQ